MNLFRKIFGTIGLITIFIFLSLFSVIEYPGTDTELNMEMKDKKKYSKEILSDLLNDNNIINGRYFRKKASY